MTTRPYETRCPDCSEMAADCCDECGCCPQCRRRGPDVGCHCDPEVDAFDRAAMATDALAVGRPVWKLDTGTDGGEGVLVGRREEAIEDIEAHYGEPWERLQGYGWTLTRWPADDE